MRDTPVPAERPELQRPRLAGAIERARRSLLAQPPPDAGDIAQAAVFPVLQAYGVDVFDLAQLRAVPAAERSAATDAGAMVVYSAKLGAVSCRLECYRPGAELSGPPPPPPVTGTDLVLRTDGRHWRASVAGAGDTVALELLAAGFAEGLQELISGGGDAATRVAGARRRRDGTRFELGVELLLARHGTEALRSRAHDIDAIEEWLWREGLLAGEDGLELDALQARERLERLLADVAGNPPPTATPLSPITGGDVRRHAERVRHLRGKLEARFDGESIDITSRSALYYVLSALALQHSREDAIPADDLVRPPDAPPPDRHARPLGRSGWYVLIDHDAEVTEERTARLREALRLEGRLEASQRGRPYPSS